MQGDVLRADTFTEVTLYLPIEYHLTVIESAGGKVVKRGTMADDPDGRTQDIEQAATIVSVPQSWVVTDDINTCKVAFDLDVIEPSAILPVTLVPKFIIPVRILYLFYEVHTEIEALNETEKSCNFTMIHENICAGNVSRHNDIDIKDVLERL